MTRKKVHIYADRITMIVGGRDFRKFTGNDRWYARYNGCWQHAEYWPNSPFESALEELSKYREPVHHTTER